MLEKILKVLFPNGLKCVFCGDDINNDSPNCICEDCQQTLPFIKGKLCKKCGNRIYDDGDYCIDCKLLQRYFEKVVSVFWYVDNIVGKVHNFKYENAKYLAKPFANLMFEKWQKQNIDIDYIIPVPICDKRFKARGYNQAELLAAEISSLLKKPMLKDYLIRIKETQTQVELNKRQRADNLKDAFHMSKRAGIKDKTILLIDDVCTTGATANECAKKILSAGASKVYVLTFARTLLKKDII